MSDQLIISLATVPDVEALRAIHKLEGLSDEGALSASLHLHKQQFGSKELPLYQQQIVSMAVIKCSTQNEITVYCPIELQSESALLTWFCELLDKETCLVSWGMDAKPLINYRLLKHGIICTRLSDLNSISLQDKLSEGHRNADADFLGLSSSLGLAEITALSRSEIIDCFLSNQLATVHKSNQSLALNTGSIFLKYQLISGAISHSEFEKISDEMSNACNQAQN